MTLSAICIGAGAEQLPSIEIAKALGLRVIAYDRNPEAPGLAAADIAKPIDIRDENAIIADAMQYHASLVLPAPIGRFLTTVGAINDAFSFPGVSRHSAVVCADKLHFNRVMITVDVPIASQHMIVDWPAEREKLISSISLPCIVKPRFGSGGRGITVCSDVGSLDLAMTTVYTEQQDILLEELIVGAEYGVDASIFDDDMRILVVRRKIVFGENVRVDAGYVTINHNGKYKDIGDQIRATLSKAVAVAGLQNCLIHADIIIDSANTAYLIEFSGRPSGMSIHGNIVPEVIGFNAIEAAVRHLLGMERFPVSKSSDVSVAVVYFPFLPGMVTALPNIRELDFPNGVKKVDLPLKIGQWLKPITTCMDVIERGYVTVQSDDPDEAEQTAHSVFHLLNRLVVTAS